MTTDPQFRTPENMPVGMLARADQLAAAQDALYGQDREELLAAVVEGRGKTKAPGEYVTLDDTEV